MGVHIRRDNRSCHFELDGTHGLGVLTKAVLILCHSGVGCAARQHVDVARQVLLVVFPGFNVVSDLLSLRVLFVTSHLVVSVDRIPEVLGDLRDSNHTVKSGLLEGTIHLEELVG